MVNNNNNKKITLEFNKEQLAEYSDLLGHNVTEWLLIWGGEKDSYKKTICKSIYDDVKARWQEIRAIQELYYE